MGCCSSIAAAFSSIDFSSAQGYAVARLAMDQAKSEGEAAAQLVQAAADIAKRPASDPSGPSGHTIDTYA